MLTYARPGPVRLGRLPSCPKHSGGNGAAPTDALPPPYLEELADSELTIWCASCASHGDGGLVVRRARAAQRQCWRRKRRTWGHASAGGSRRRRHHLRTLGISILAPQSRGPCGGLHIRLCHRDGGPPVRDRSHPNADVRNPIAPPASSAAQHCSRPRRQCLCCWLLV
eukprot:COSAG01_NODE_9548_length_2413_cov_4.644339_2_plen_168_part_00